MYHNATDIENSRRAHFNDAYSTKRKKSRVNEILTQNESYIEFEWAEFEASLIAFLNHMGSAEETFIE